MNTLERTHDGSTEETDERDCPNLCFFGVPNDINLELTTCSIDQNRRDTREQPSKRLIGGNTAISGAFPYVVRLAFQSFDQFHSDSQEIFEFKLEPSFREILERRSPGV